MPQDTIKAVRASIAADKAAQASLDAAQTGRIQELENMVKWCCAGKTPAPPVVVAPPAVIPPPPPPPPPPPAESGYPVPVVELSYEPTWNYKNRAAPVTTKRLGVDALPAEWYYDAVGHILYVINNCDVTGWDLTGVSLYNQGLFTAKFRSCLIGRSPNSDYMVRNGDDGGTVASVMELYSCRIDGRGTFGTQSDWSTVNSSAAAIFRAYDTDWIDADYRHFSGYQAVFQRNYLGRTGVRTAPVAHVDQMLLRAATTFTDCFLDARGSPNTGHATGNVQTESGAYAFVRTIVIGAGSMGAGVAVSGAAGASFTFTAAIVEPGSSQYLAANGATSASSGSLGYVTAANIDASLIA